MYTNNQQRMVEEQIVARGIKEERIIDSFLSVDRALFVPEELKSYAYEDSPLPIGYGQTISQPFIVAFMTKAAKLSPRDKVLEIGTGSGYQAAVLSKLCADVYSVEVVGPLSDKASKLFKKLNLTNVHTRKGDGYQGWKEEAPFDAIILTAAPAEIPQTLVDQLKEGGRLIVPVGTYSQELMRVVKTKDGIRKEEIMPVKFVPMVRGEKQ